MGEIFDENGQLDNDLIPQIIWHLSPGVKYTTGQTVDVCGGLSLFNNYAKEKFHLEHQDFKLQN